MRIREVSPYYVSFSEDQALHQRDVGHSGVVATGLALVWGMTEMHARMEVISYFGQSWCALYSLDEVVDSGPHYFPDGVTVTCGTAVEVVYVDERAGGKRFVARFDNHGAMQQFITHVVETGADTRSPSMGRRLSA